MFFLSSFFFCLFVNGKGCGVNAFLVWLIEKKYVAAASFLKLVLFFCLSLIFCSLLQCANVGFVERGVIEIDLVMDQVIFISSYLLWSMCL